ncbi:MAG: hypothetical protein ABID45_04920 [Patescibacteria group bacterium]
MANPKYSDSKEKLIEVLKGTSGSGSQSYDIAKAILDVKIQEDHIKETKKLTFATWCLVFTTITLVLATIILAIITYYTI